jgi:hypothetical protein
MACVLNQNNCHQPCLPQSWKSFSAQDQIRTISHCHTRMPHTYHGYLIRADKTEDMEIITSWLDWTMTLSQLFNHHDSEELAAMIADIRHHVNGDFDASRLLQILDSKKTIFG